MAEEQTATKEQEQTQQSTSTEQPNTDAKNQQRQQRQQRGGRKRRPRRKERQRPEFDQKIAGIRRVTRVMAGGRRFSFSVCLIAGNRQGRVGVGLAKAGDTALAIEKAARNAKTNMIEIPLTENKSIPHDIQAKYCGSEILMMPAPGRGIKAGSAVRTVLELAGVTDVSAKILSRSKSPINNARAAVKALSSLEKPQENAQAAEEASTNA